MKIKIVSSQQNFKKVHGMFSNDDTDFSHFQCNCKNMDFLKTGYEVTIIYPDKILPECLQCIEKAKGNSNILFISDDLNIHQRANCIYAGAKDCFDGETLHMIEPSARFFFTISDSKKKGITKQSGKVRK